MGTVLNIAFSVSIILGASWLSRTKPALAGFIVSLPLTSLIVLAISYTQWGDAEKTSEFARSIFVSVPLSLVFFLPFLFAKQLKWPFWSLYGAGFALLIVAYFVHSAIFKVQSV